MSDHKQRYIEFCQTAPPIPLFFQPWWLDLVCQPDHWNVALSFSQGGEITGVLPYYQQKSMGLSTIRRPLLTPYLGVWLRYPENPQKRTQRYAFEKKTVSNLLKQLPKTVFATFHHPVELANGLPFLWQGYQVSNWYTYRFTSGAPVETIRAGMKASVRNKIDKAEKALLLTESFSPEAFYQINQLSFDRQGLAMPYSLPFFKKMDQLLSSKGQRKILVVKDPAGLDHAAIYLVWDQKTLYNLALGGHPERRKSGAVQLLLWKGIQLALSKGLDFDFEGSVMENIEGVFRDFGAERVAYLRTERFANRWWKVLYTLLKGK